MKKLLVFSLAFVLIISALLLLAGCKKECAHSYEKTGTPPTCTEAGEEKFSCTKCDYYYTTKIEATGVHNVQNGVCTVCGGRESTPGLEYSQNDDGTYTVTGIGTCTETEIVIGIYNNRDVTTIGDQAFYNCFKLTSIELPNSLTTIGYNAFYGCDSLTSIVIPKGVTAIGDSAFSGRTSLTSITVADDNKNYKSVDGNLYSKDGKTFIQYAMGKADTTFAVSEGVTTIGEWAFYNCTSLKSIDLPNSLTTIGDDAFSYCTSLESIELPDSLTTIGDGAFSLCTSLTIYCEVAEKPSGWSDYWNSGRPVVWGYTGE